MAQISSAFDSPDASQPAPASDPDPYSMGTTRAIFNSSSSTLLPPHVDFASLPHGLPLLGPLTGFSNARIIRTINARLASVQAVIHRPLTVPEDQAVAWHTAKGLAVGSWGPTIGVVVGLSRWWQTREEMRWLWMGKLKDEGVNQAWRDYYEAQKTAAAGGQQEAAAGATEGAAKMKKPPGSVRWDGGRLLMGEREVMRAFSPLRREAIVQGFRSFPYIGFGWLVSSLALSAYAASVTAVGEMRDQRLETLERELMDQVRKTRNKRRGDVPVSTPGIERARQPPAQRIDTSANVDDGASPASDYAFFGETEEEERTRLSGNNESKQQQQQRQGGFRRSTPDPFQTSGRQGPFQQDRYETQSRRSESSFDDASPTGGAGMIGTTDSDNESNNSQSGSAWERIRQNASSSSSSPSSSSPTTSPSDRPLSTGAREGGGREGAWDRLQQRNARGLPPQQQQQQRQQQRRPDHDHDEAQKEFDARVEKERAGGDFGGGDRKW